MNDTTDAAEFDEEAWEAGQLEDETVNDLSDQQAIGESGASSGEPMRVSEDIAGRVPTWKGVRSCGDGSRAVDEMTPHYDSWVNNTIASHPDRTPLFKGYSGRNWYKNKRHSDGRRSCKGGWETLTVYVDFA